MREMGTTYTAAERRAIAARTATKNAVPDDGSRTPPHGDPLMDAFRTQATKETLAYMQGVIDGLDGSDTHDEAQADSYAEGFAVGERSRGELGSGDDAVSADPPSMVELRWCPVCGRTDRQSNLPDKHVKGNGRRDARDCPGKVEAVTYTMFKVLD